MAHLRYSFAGDSFAIGRQHGAALAAELRAEYEPALQQLAEARGESTDATLRAFAEKYSPVVDELDGTALDEVRGVASGAGLPFDAAFFAAYRDGTPATFGPELRSDNPQSGDGCTAVVCSGEVTASGGVLIGQTKDTGMPLDRYRLQRVRRIDGRTHLLCNCKCPPRFPTPAPPSSSPDPLRRSGVGRLLGPALQRCPCLGRQLCLWRPPRPLRWRRDSPDVNYKEARDECPKRG